MDDRTRELVSSGLRIWAVVVGIDNVDAAVTHILKFIEDQFKNAEAVQEQVTQAEA